MAKLREGNGLQPTIAQKTSNGQMGGGAAAGGSRFDAPGTWGSGRAQDTKINMVPEKSPGGPYAQQPPPGVHPAYRQEQQRPNGPPQPNGAGPGPGPGGSSGMINRPMAAGQRYPGAQRPIEPDANPMGKVQAVSHVQGNNGGGYGGGQAEEGERKGLRKLFKRKGVEG